MVVEQAVVHLLEGEPRRVLDLPRSLSRSVREVASIVRTEAELLSVDREVPAAARTATPGDDLSIRVRKSLLDALFHARRGNERAFGEAIERALRMAAPEHLRRPFKEAPEPIRKALATRSDLTARHPWLADAESGSSRARPAPGSSGADGDSSSLIEPLTGKELEVLGLLAQLLTTEETAAAMFVSVNTVRTHVRNILRKMGVARRHQAIRRAWDLGILPVA
jgi:LuxR family maltose regulon positive regulatory protein